jgi:hypothetical protein
MAQIVPHLQRALHDEKQLEGVFAFTINLASSRMMLRVKQPEDCRYEIGALSVENAYFWNSVTMNEHHGINSQVVRHGAENLFFVESSPKFEPILVVRQDLLGEDTHDALFAKVVSDFL